MKGLGLVRNLFLSTVLLFNSANAQLKFSKDYEAKVVYNGRLYIVDRYKVDNQKRKYAYEIHTVNEYGQRDELIGDEKSEFHDYKNISLTADYFLDRYLMIEDLNKIKDLFRKTNEYFQLNKLIHGATLEVTRFGTEVALMNKVTKERLIKKINDEYGKKIKDYGKELAREVFDAFINGKLRKKGISKRLF